MLKLLMGLQVTCPILSDMTDYVVVVYILDSKTTHRVSLYDLKLKRLPKRGNRTL